MYIYIFDQEDSGDENKFFESKKEAEDWIENFTKEMMNEIAEIDNDPKEKYFMVGRKKLLLSRIEKVKNGKLYKAEKCEFDCK